MGKRQRKIAVLFIVFLLAGMVWPASVSSADDKDKIENSIKEKQSAIGEAEKQKAALQSGLTDVKKLVAELENSQKNLEDYAVRVDTIKTYLRKLISLLGVI